MAWLAKTPKGVEYIFRLKPRYNLNGNYWSDYGSYKDEDVYSGDTAIKLPRGSINKIIGKQVTFEECPIKI